MTEKVALDIPTVWFKTQRALRTIVQGVIAALSVWAALQLIFPQVLAELATVLPESWILWLAGTIAAVGAVAGALSRIMAIPAVNTFLTRWLDLGSVPKKNLEPTSFTSADGTEVHVVTTVLPDLKDPAVKQQADAAPLALPGETIAEYRERTGL